MLQKNRFRAFLLLPFFLTSCILVDDFGARWGEAKPDACVGKIAAALYYGEFRREMPMQESDNYARAITLGGQPYLLLKKQLDDKGGRLYRFTVKHGIFERYRLNPTMREAFEREHPNAPVSLARDTVTLAALTPEIEALLATISQDARYWESEDKTLYNPMRNPLCRFEDRDLKHLDDEKPKKKRKPKRKVD